MTEQEEKVFQWAFNLTDSIIAGDYNIPKEMTYCINSLQDAVYELANKKGLDIKSMLTKEYVEFRDKVRKDRIDTLMKRLEKTKRSQT